MNCMVNPGVTAICDGGVSNFYHRFRMTGRVMLYLQPIFISIGLHSENWWTLGGLLAPASRESGTMACTKIVLPYTYMTVGLNI